MKFKDDLQRYLYYQAQIDYCYYVIQGLIKENNKPQLAIEKMIDAATGFDKERMRRQIEGIKPLLKTMIRCKKKLEYETEADENLLKKLKEFNPNTIK